jgi:hypothetical protein
MNRAVAPDRASHITGTVLHIDGGTHSHYWR